jgi:D-alanyl-D-alanine carboxypeptidase
VDYDKLGLRATFWEYMEDVPAAAGPRAHQYFGDVDVTDWFAGYDLFGGGGIVTDARELALFMRHLLKGRVFDRESTLAAMTGEGTQVYRLGLMTMMAGDHLCVGHQGFWNTFAFHVPALDLSLGGTILNHDAENGWKLVERLVAVASEHAARQGVSTP